MPTQLMKSLSTSTLILCAVYFGIVCGNLDCNDQQSGRAECWATPDVSTISCKNSWHSLIIHHLNSADVEVDAPSYLFKDCSTLTQLHLSGVSQRKIGPQLFADMPNVTSFSITKSPNLTAIDNRWFDHCPIGLKVVTLSETGLRGTLSVDSFVKCPIRTLNLKHNQIERLIWEGTPTLEKLKHLLLSNNSLKSSLEEALGVTSPGKPSALIPMKNLEILDISSCQLDKIMGCLWSGGCEPSTSRTKLQYLHLTNNWLKNLSSEAFRGLPGLKRLHLDGNPRLFMSVSSLGALLSLSPFTHPNLKSLAIPQNASSKSRDFLLCSSDASTLSFNPYVPIVISRLKADFCNNNNIKCSSAPMQGIENMVVEYVNSPATCLTRGGLLALVPLTLVVGIVIGIVGGICWRWRTHRAPFEAPKHLLSPSIQSPQINSRYNSAITLEQINRDVGQLYRPKHPPCNIALSMNDSGRSSFYNVSALT